MDEQLAFLKLIAERLDGAGIPYMLTGSLAMTLYGTPRMTRDIDLVVELEPGDAAVLVELFAGDCVLDEGAVAEAVSRRGMFNAIHADWVVKADFIVRKESPYRRLELERRRTVDVLGTPVAVVSPEDLLLSKLARDRGRERSPHGDLDGRYRAMLLQRAPVERLMMACGMFSAAQALVRAGIVAGGVADEVEIRRELFLRFYGSEIADPGFRERVADEIAARSGSDTAE